MSFSLEFSEEFFFAEGEPYDRGEIATTSRSSREPISVWSAIELMRESEPNKWREMAIEVFGADGFLPSEAVLSEIRRTDTCSSLSAPIRVYIDSDSRYYVEVFEEK